MSYRQRGIIEWGPKNISFKECECPWCKSKDQKRLNRLLSFFRYGLKDGKAWGNSNMTSFIGHFLIGFIIFWFGYFVGRNNK